MIFYIFMSVYVHMYISLSLSDTEEEFEYWEKTIHLPKIDAMQDESVFWDGIDFLSRLVSVSMIHEHTHTQGQSVDSTYVHVHRIYMIRICTYNNFRWPWGLWERFILYIPKQEFEAAVAKRQANWQELQNLAQIKKFAEEKLLEQTRNAERLAEKVSDVYCDTARIMMKVRFHECVYIGVLEGMKTEIGGEACWQWIIDQYLPFSASSMVQLWEIVRIWRVPSCRQHLNYMWSLLRKTRQMIRTKSLVFVLNTLSFLSGTN